MLGVYDDPPPHEFSFVKGYNIGNGGVAKLAGKLTAIENDVNRFIGSLNPLP